MKRSSVLRSLVALACVASVAPMVSAQNSIRVFTPINVRASASNTGYGAQSVAFNSSTLNLTCSASPITAVLSSTTDSTGNLLVDNDIQVGVTTSTSSSGLFNICTVDNSENCFTSSYQTRAGSLIGQDPDTFVSTGGVAPIDISKGLQPGPLQLQINLVDTGGYLASSTIYLNTNCTLNGVTGPSAITGNPIPQSNPTPQQLTQTFPFNPATNQHVQFTYDLSQAQAAGSLSITNNTIPGTEDLPVDPSTFQTTYVPGTSFATSSCLVHSGELIDGTPACKLFTLECTIGTGTTESGAQCPISSLPNEVFQDVFDGPAFTLPDIVTSTGLTFHQGVAFLMASEGWTGGPCTFDPASGLQDLPCPQNLLSSFSGPGLYIATGHTSHPNSTFIPIAQVPEDLTTVTVQNQQPGGWINNATAKVTLSSQPPILAGTGLPGSTSFVPAPIQSVTYGVSPASSVPVPGTPPTTDTALQNPIACPGPANPLDPPATVFNPPIQPVGPLADGNYMLHYYAQDCAGTEELKFTQDANANWSTSYYTVPINVDTIAPVVASGPVLSPLAGSTGYTVGQTVTASYSCTDERSGVVRCGTASFSPSTPVLNTGTIIGPVDTSSAGVKTYTVIAVDAAGNQSSASVTYTVAAYNAAIQLFLRPTSVTYPQGANAIVRVAPANGHRATGRVQLYDSSTLLQTAWLQGDGAAYLRIWGLAAGVHPLTAVYAGDAFHPGGSSAPATFNVAPAPVDLDLSCWGGYIPYGANYHCGVFTSSEAGAPKGFVTYRYDNGSPINLPLQNGVAQFTLVQPAVGTHTVVVTYPAQTNYAAAGPRTTQFTVTQDRR